MRRRSFVVLLIGCLLALLATPVEATTAPPRKGETNFFSGYTVKLPKDRSSNTLFLEGEWQIPSLSCRGFARTIAGIQLVARDRYYQQSAAAGTIMQCDAKGKVSYWSFFQRITIPAPQTRRTVSLVTNPGDWIRGTIRSQEVILKNGKEAVKYTFTLENRSRGVKKVTWSVYNLLLQNKEVRWGINLDTSGNITRPLAPFPVVSFGSCQLNQKSLSRLPRTQYLLRLKSKNPVSASASATGPGGESFLIWNS